MKCIVCEMFDKKSGLFQGLEVEVNEATAIRKFANAIKVSGSIMNNFASDFELYSVGEYTPENGHIELFDSPQYLLCGSDVKEKEF